MCELDGKLNLKKTGSHVFDRYGLTLAWLTLNHGDLPIYSHAKTWVYGENEERLISHTDYSLYSGITPLLNQWFFYKPEEVNSGLYRWDSQLPRKKTVSKEESVAKQKEVLEFWFGDLEQGFPKEMSQQWFAQQDPGKTSPFDQEIRERFQKDIILATLGAYDDWKKTAQGKLALILLLDQFPRNIFRGTPQAFAYDKLSKEIAQNGLQEGQDLKLSFAERLFFYLPLEHSEDLNDQKHASSLIGQLAKEVPSQLKEDFKEHYRMAIMHQKAIENYGRFPWRNSILNRKSSPKEEIYLSNPENRA